MSCLGQKPALGFSPQPWASAEQTGGRTHRMGRGPQQLSSPSFAVRSNRLQAKCRVHRGGGRRPEWTRLLSIPPAPAPSTHSLLLLNSGHGDPWRKAGVPPGCGVIMSSGSCPPQEAQGLSTERCRHPQGDSCSCGPEAREHSFWAVRASPAAPATHARALPLRDTNIDYTPHPVPISKLSTTSPQPTLSGNRLPGICSPRVWG